MCTSVQMELADGTLINDLVDCGNGNCLTSKTPPPKEDD